MRRGNVWNISVLARLVTAVCMLGACTGSAGGEAPPVSPSAVASPSAAPPSPSPSPTPSPTPSPPEAPAGVEEDSAAGAKKAIQHFFDLRQHAYETGDTEPIKVVSHAECRYCTISIEEAEDHAGRGERVSGPELVLHDVTYIGMGEGVYPTYDVSFTQMPWALSSRDGTLLDENPKRREIDGVVSLERAAGSWHVRALTVQDFNE